MLASRENLPLLAELLAEQQRLDTPVARFSAAHDAHPLSQCTAPRSDVLALRPQLIPFSKPQPGEQYAFEVDLDSCTGCKSCVAACHALNGLDETETWRDVGVLVSPSRARPFTAARRSSARRAVSSRTRPACPPRTLAASAPSGASCSSGRGPIFQSSARPRRSRAAPVRRRC